MSINRLLSCVVPLAFGGLSLLGCSQTTTPPGAPPAKVTQADGDHDHDDHDDHDHDHDDGHAHEHGHDDYKSPTTVAAGLAELEKICGGVKEELAEGDRDEADAKVHMVGHLIDDLHGLVADAKPSPEVLAGAKKALDDIFDCFDKMDTALHAADEEVAKKLDYAEHAPTIEAAIQKLKELVK